MGKMQKIVCLLAVFLLSLGVLSGCKLGGVTTKMESMDGSFAVTVSGTWKEYEHQINGQSICFINETEDTILSIERVPICSQGVTITKADIKTFVKDSVFSGADLKKWETPSRTIEVPNMTVQEAAEVTLEGQKAYVFYMESDMNFYFVTWLSMPETYEKSLALLEKGMAKFQENTEKMTEKPEGISDTELWCNTVCALLTLDYGDNVFYMGGCMPEDTAGKEQITALLQDWGMTNSRIQEYVYTMEEYGQNKSATMLYDTFHLERYSSPEEASATFANVFGEAELNMVETVYEAKQKFGDNAMLGYDGVRGIWMYGLGYAAGDFTYEEAMEGSYALAVQLQKAFSSWDEMMESYFYGCDMLYHLQGRPEELERERQLYEAIKASAWNPYTLDWNTPLEKTW